MRQVFKATLCVVYAPAMLAIFIGLALWVVAAGHSHGWLLGLLVVAVAVSLLAERCAPYEPVWNRVQGEGWRDLTHAVVNEASAFAGVLALPALTQLSPWVGVWPHHWPLGWQLLGAILVADFGLTMTHWLSHHWPLLWRFHAVHHSVTRFYGFNGLLKHPIHQFMETAMGTALLVLAGMPQQVAGLLAFAVGLQLLLQHSNVDMRIGPLRHVLALAPVHRFHHRKWAGIGDVNFGLFTTLWDQLLGTAVFEPSARFAPGDFGIGKRPDYPQAYLDQLMEPFRPGPADRW
ncbi:MAG: sterol desaturase family protein [Polaromonas sp.]